MELKNMEDNKLKMAGLIGKIAGTTECLLHFPISEETRTKWLEEMYKDILDLKNLVLEI
jgi:hypothetical protein